VISKATAEHFLWRNVCDGWYLVNQPTRLTVLQERMPPGTSEAWHFHREAYQFFFILAGAATLELNGHPQELHPHEGAEVPPLIPHQLWNLSDASVEFLVISQPNSREDRVFVAAPEELER
jgi:mannose-6-phosphate isomerase-like protein (cupin superfamily)